jgi:hypothetical protein
VNAETTRLARDKPHHVYPGESHFRRPGETPETCLALLITQRSRVQIPPPLPGQRPLLVMEGAFCIWFASGSANGDGPAMLTGQFCRCCTGHPPRRCPVSKLARPPHVGRPAGVASRWLRQSRRGTRSPGSWRLRGGWTGLGKAPLGVAADAAALRAGLHLVEHFWLAIGLGTATAARGHLLVRAGPRRHPHVAPGADDGASGREPKPTPASARSGTCQPGPERPGLPARQARPFHHARLVQMPAHA